MINNEAAEKLIIFMMDKAITYRNRKLYVLGTFKKPYITENIKFWVGNRMVS